MERLTLKQARERVAAQTPAPPEAHAIDWTRPGLDAVIIASMLPGAGSHDERCATLTIAHALLGYQAHLDYEAGYAAALAGPVGSIVKPGDRIQDMEMFHRFNGQVRILRVERIGDKEGKPAAVCSSANGDKVTIRLDRIHRKNIKTGWRVLDGEGR